MWNVDKSLRCSPTYNTISSASKKQPSASPIFFFNVAICSSVSHASPIIIALPTLYVQNTPPFSWDLSSLVTVLFAVHMSLVGHVLERTLSWWATSSRHFSLTLFALTTIDHSPSGNNTVKVGSLKCSFVNPSLTRTIVWPPVMAIRVPSGKRTSIISSCTNSDVAESFHNPLHIERLRF